MESKSRFSENLHYFRTKMGYTQKRVAGILGIKQQTVAAWESGRSTPSPSIICMLAEIFGISTDQLLMNVKKDGGNDRLEKIPIVSYINAEKFGDPEAYRYVIGDFAGDEVILRIDNDAMEPVLWHGDLVLVRLGSDVKTDDVVVIEDESDKNFIMRAVVSEEGILLQPFSSKHKVQFMPAAAGRSKKRIVGKVISSFHQWV